MPSVELSYSETCPLSTPTASWDPSALTASDVTATPSPLEVTKEETHSVTTPETPAALGVADAVGVLAEEVKGRVRCMRRS